MCASMGVQMQVCDKAGGCLHSERPTNLYTVSSSSILCTDVAPISNIDIRACRKYPPLSLHRSLDFGLR
jgi:hypothetical protein